MKKNIIQIPFYREEDWLLLKDESVDTNSFESTYKDYISSITENFNELEEAGLKPVKSYIIAKELIYWLKENDRENTTENRAVYIALKNKKRTNN